MFGLIIFPIVISNQANASHNPNLFVSAENPLFDNHFAGSMVVEVVVNDPNLGDIDEPKGEPDVTINGNDLRTIQGSDGRWYAYFANVNKAKIADQLVLDRGSGAEGQSLDFGVFCSSNTDESVFGASFPDTDGFAIPRSGGILGTTNGASSFTVCLSSSTSTSPNLNNVVRNPKSLNTNPNVLPGQIGLNPNAWPVIQLFSFGDDVEIQYNGAGGTQTVKLEYDEISNISLNLDRKTFPRNAEVFAIINDQQLNQDPTAVDSWTFNINSPEATFYQAFTRTGSNSANGGPGLINLVPRLSSLGFEDNGKLTLSLNSVAELKTNKNQPTNSVTDGKTTFSQIVTFVESQPNSGIFESLDFGDTSTIGISDNSPRGQSAIIEYNSTPTSIVSGSFTSSLSLNTQGGQLKPGQKIPITIVDVDQNINPGAKDDLDVFRSTAIIPSLQLGNPITLERASNLKFHAFSSDSLDEGIMVPSSVPDVNSDRLIVDTRSTGNIDFDKISLDLGISANTLQSLFIDDNAFNSDGTNWLNYDLRSFQQHLGVNDFSDTSITLLFGGLSDQTPVTIVDRGDLPSAQGLVQIDNLTIEAINAKSGRVILVINFDSSNNLESAGIISNEQDTQPIVFDFFSFGKKNGKQINNAIYRLELEETANNSGTFTGIIEYTVTNQLNQFDPNLIKTLRTIDDKIKFLVNDRLVDEEGINIRYLDLAGTGTNKLVSSKNDIKTHSGNVSLDSKSYRFGQLVTVTISDQISIDDSLKHNYGK